MAQDLKSVISYTQKAEMFTDFVFGISMYLIFEWVSGTAGSPNFFKALDGWVKYLGYGMIIVCFLALAATALQIRLKHKRTRDIQNIQYGNKPASILLHRSYKELALKFIATLLILTTGILLGAKTIHSFALLLAIATFLLMSINLSLLLSKRNSPTCPIRCKNFLLSLFFFVECFAATTVYLHMNAFGNISDKTVSSISFIGCLGAIFLALTIAVGYYCCQPSYTYISSPSSSDNGDDSESNLSINDEKQNSSSHLLPKVGAYIIQENNEAAYQHPVQSELSRIDENKPKVGATLQ